MNSRIAIVVLVIYFTTVLGMLAQNSGTKTAQDLKKAENVVNTGKTLVNIFKKKKKAESQETTSTNPNTGSIDSIQTEKTEDLKTVNPQLDDIPLTKDAAILFRNCVTKTSNKEKNEITALMNIIATPDGNQFHINDQYSKEFPFTVFVYPLDLNSDGTEELALVYGHPAISGDNVISTLFIKDTKGHYNANFGFIGMLVILADSTKDLPDIAIGGPGFEFPVWRWNGKNYNQFSTISNDKLENSKVWYVEDASKAYVKTIAH